MNIKLLLLNVHIEKTRIINLWLNDQISTDDFLDAQDFLKAILYPWA